MRDGITTTMGDLLLALHGSEKMVSGFSAAIQKMDLFTKSTMHSLMVLVREVAKIAWHILWL